MKNLLLLTVVTVFVSFFNFSFAKNFKEISFSVSSDTFHTYVFVRTPPLKTVYNDFLTKKTEKQLMVYIKKKAYKNGVYVDFRKGKSHVIQKTTFEWIYILIATLYIVAMRYKWNVFDKVRKRNVINGLLFAIVLVFWGVLGFSGIELSGSYGQFAAYFTIGILIGSITALTLSASITDRLTYVFVMAITMAVVGGFQSGLAKREISWYSLIYTLILFIFAYGIGYLIRKKPPVDTEDKSFEGTI